MQGGGDCLYQPCRIALGVKGHFAEEQLQTDRGQREDDAHDGDREGRQCEGKGEVRPAHRKPGREHKVPEGRTHKATDKYWELMASYQRLAEDMSRKSSAPKAEVKIKG